MFTTILLFDVQPYRCLFTARLRPFRGGNIPAAIAVAANNAICLCLVLAKNWSGFRLNKNITSVQNLPVWAHWATSETWWKVGNKEQVAVT